MVVGMNLRSALIAIASSYSAAVPFSAQKSFGHSIKGGPLPASSEVTTFEHSCGTPPCVITHVSVPSIYPSGGDPWNWTEGIVSFYVDGETEAGVNLTLLELAGEGHFNTAGDNAQGGDSMPDGSPWGISMMGRTAKSGAVYSTLRVPFGSSIRVTIKPPPMAQHQSVFWFVIRGLEAHPVRLGDIELPASARLRLYRTQPTYIPKLQFLTLAAAPAGISGVLARVHLDARSSDFAFLEACMRFFPGESETNQPMFLSSGAEDYFLGASYFDEGMFKTPESGLTWFNRSTSSLAAYKTHVTDNVVWHDGMRIVFRACEETTGCGDLNHCPNQFCNASQRAEAAAQAALRATTTPSPNLTEYLLGAQGATCDDACYAQGLFCNPEMNLGDADQGATMMAHLGVEACLKDHLGWWAPDQPNYVSAADPNYNECLGWVGYPTVSQCSASYPTAQRVCRCSATAPPVPPGPLPSGSAEYSSLVFTYEWPKAATKPLQSQADPTGAALRVIQHLVSLDLLTENEEDLATDLVLADDKNVLSLLEAFTSTDVDNGTWKRIARQLKRTMAKQSSGFEKALYL